MHDSGCTRETAVGAFELHPACGEPVDVRAFHGTISITTEIAVEIVGGDEIGYYAL
jgi:hypothetical protein